MEPLLVARVDIADDAVYKNIQDAGGIDVKNLAPFMCAEEVPTGGHERNATNTVKAVGFRQGAVDYVVGIPVAKKDVAIPGIASRSIKEIDFVFAAISGDDIAIGVQNEI